MLQLQSLVTVEAVGSDFEMLQRNGGFCFANNFFTDSNCPMAYNRAKVCDVPACLLDIIFTCGKIAGWNVGMSKK